ncbi:conserved hypothetical protein [Vibrio nigripulchritudo SOn1]|uniref:Glycosyltransferase 2-like domain-containing protein n=1 Tax=Vibrio nigripulchritudo SOn1 TaxID=1238450 RepID=A0AAV2VZA1_9VIBR|nr:glycosyltransferase family 2 protein [Vibrio nigripulchritudo]CCO49810.1 conserved hypothetical protein [Vibrio nigripulchritudo SOn1]
MTLTRTSEPTVAILLPCFNEQGAIGDTIKAFRHQFPDADIYVYDNNSTDHTVKEALSAGAIVKREYRQGKGEVVRRMFSDVEADIYIMADGDNTYDASDAPDFVRILQERDLDMVVGQRTIEQSAYPSGHILGNKAFSLLINYFFKSNLKDVFSGYRIMSRRFVKSMPVISDGFQIETELTVHALHHKFPIKEIRSKYLPRPEGTASKLKTFRDGFKILNFILFLIRDVRPLFFFGWLSAVLAATSLSLGIPVVAEFIQTGLVAKFPTAILASSIGVLSTVSMFTGLILDNVSRGRLESKLMVYKSINP